MQIDGSELFEIMGFKDPPKPGFSAAFALDGSGRRASIVLDRDGVLSADVTEEVDGEDGNVIVSLTGQLGDDGMLEIEGFDGSGESGDERDPRAAASAFRRLVRPMAQVA